MGKPIHTGASPCAEVLAPVGGINALKGQNNIGYTGASPCAEVLAPVGGINAL